MSNSMIIKEEVFFKADAAKVWHLLTNPEMTKQYMFGSEIVSDWKIGSPILWKGQTADGTDIIYVKGEVLEYIEGQKVTSTMFDPHGGMEDIPENYVNLTYELTTTDGGTLLTITQGDFAGAANGKKRYEESKQGWSAMVIPLMQKLV